MEEMYHYVWKNRLFAGAGHRLCDGRDVRVISPGILNTDAGPDFSHARIWLDGTEWCGNVEIHVKASDWHRHHHDTDPAYDSVLLHVVAVDDTRIHRSDGSLIPQLVIAVPQEVCDAWQSLRKGLDVIRCHRYIGKLDRLRTLGWMHSAGMERLQAKASHVAEILKWSGGDWQQTLFIIFARALGFGLNADPMEMTARALPLNFAARHADSQGQLDALVFGVAGMLDPSLYPHDDYYQFLCREFKFLALKYNLHTPKDLLWKMARTRPQNFPHRRLAVLARSLHGGFSLMSDIIDCQESTDLLRKLLTFPLEGYWTTHYAFGQQTSASPSTMSATSINLLLINTVAPFLYCYGALRGKSRHQDRAVDLLEQLPPERNSLVMSWNSSGLKAANAFESQALLHLRKTYCDAERCLQCRFGTHFMQQLMNYLSGQ